jgi:transcriptional regulator with XRE-family HTH domain
MAAEEVAEHFGRNLTRLRRRVDLSQDELGLRASLHRTEISLLERGLRLARVDTVVKLSGALETDPGALFDGLSWMPGGTLIGRFSLSPETGGD